VTRHAVVASAAAAALLAAAPAAAQAPPSLVFREVQKGSTFAFVDNPPRNPTGRRPRLSPGDAFVVTVSLTKGRVHRGTLRATCTIVATSKDPNRAPSLCYGVFTFKEGQVVAVISVANLDAKRTVGAVIGGTGAYAGARGTFTSVVSRLGTIDTIDFSD
jgi:hypothetical protein